MKEKKITPDTIARTIILVIAIANTVLTMLGKNPLPFADDDIYTAVSIIATLAASAWAWWKNICRSSERKPTTASITEMINYVI